VAIPPKTAKNFSGVENIYKKSLKIMDNNIQNALDNFLGKDAQKATPAPKAQETLKNTDGLLERIDKTYITESGKILLKD
jgi:hypothetical protein